jgi:hypothetical protein
VSLIKKAICKFIFVNGSFSIARGGFFVTHQAGAQPAQGKLPPLRSANFPNPRPHDYESSGQLLNVNIL